MNDTPFAYGPGYFNRKLQEAINIPNTDVRNALFTPLPVKIAGLPDEVRRDAEWVVHHTSVALSLYFQIHSIIEATEKCQRMQRRYPWHGTDISKAEHLEFVWHAFTNQCYMFKERCKMFLNVMNRLRRAFGDPEVQVRAVLKDIDKRVGEYIRFRGRHIHEGDYPPDAGIIK